MISLDISIMPAIIIFLVLVAALNYILFKPLARIRSERDSRTTGLIARAQEHVKYQQDLFNRYQAAIKNARMEGYKKQEQLRVQALQKGAELLAKARESAELAVQQSRISIQEQVEIARKQLALEAQDAARKISAVVLEKTD